MTLRTLFLILFVCLTLNTSCIEKIVVYTDVYDAGVPADYTILTCSLNDSPEANFGVFGSTPEPWEEGGEIPVWVPTQGGIVTGFNLLLTGTPDRALTLRTRIWDTEDGSLLGEETVKKIKLNCLNDAGGQRHLKEFMAAFDKSYLLEELGGRPARLEVEFTFADADNNTYSVLGEYTGVLTLVDWTVGY